jgi:hypothetical protein
LSVAVMTERTRSTVELAERTQIGRSNSSVQNPNLATRTLLPVQIPKLIRFGDTYHFTTATVILKQKDRMSSAQDAKVEEPLETVEWVLWQHHLPRHVRNDEQWKKDTSEVAHFFARHTAAPYTADLGHLPLPSESFFLKNDHGEDHCAPTKHIEYSLFKHGTEPSWSDEHCKGELNTKQYFPAELLDTYWHHLVEGVMNGKIDDKHIVAIRVVDKSHGKHPLYKLEVWLDTANQQLRDNIRSQAMKYIPADENHRFKFHWRDFSNGPKEAGAHKAPSESSQEEVQIGQEKSTDTLNNDVPQ